MCLLVREHLKRRNQRISFLSASTTVHSDSSSFSPSSASARLSRVTTVLIELSKSRARTLALVLEACEPLTNTLDFDRLKNGSSQGGNSLICFSLEKCWSNQGPWSKPRRLLPQDWRQAAQGKHSARKFQSVLVCKELPYPLGSQIVQMSRITHGLIPRRTKKTHDRCVVHSLQGKQRWK